MALECGVNCVREVILLRVLRSQILMEPRLDPTMIWSSERVKVSEVSAEGLLLLLPVVSTEMGLGVSTL